MSRFGKYEKVYVAREDDNDSRLNVNPHGLAQIRSGFDSVLVGLKLGMVI